jgi:hypothetical protein
MIVGRTMNNAKRHAFFIVIEIEGQSCSLRRGVRQMMNLIRDILVVCCALAMAGATATSGTAQQQTTSQPAAFKTWQIESGVSGGLIGRSENFTLTSDGQVTFEDHRRRTRATQKVSAMIISEVTQLLKELNLPTTSSVASGKEWGPDQIASHFIVTLDGKKYVVQQSGPHLDLALDEAQQNMLSRLNQTLAQVFTEDLKRNAKEVDFGLGKVWILNEGAQNWRNPNPVWVGTLTRRGQSNIFEAVWRKRGTGEEVRDTVRIVTQPHYNVRLYRTGPKREGLRTYFEGVGLGWFFDDPGRVSGSATGAKPGYMWSARVTF